MDMNAIGVEVADMVDDAAPSRRDDMGDPHGLNEDWRRAEIADRLLGEAQSALARRDAEGAAELLADAVCELDAIGANDPEREEPRERRLGSRLLAVLRGIARIHDDELDALIAEG